MNILGLIVSVFFPLCGTQGAKGITPPGPVDFTHLQRLGHSEFLAAPPDTLANPDTVLSFYPVPPATLFAAIQAVAAAQPRTYLLDTEPTSLQAAYVIRSAAFNFPDIVTLAILPEPNNQSGLIFYSHAVYGAGDYGVNHHHEITWVAALNQKVLP